MKTKTKVDILQHYLALDHQIKHFLFETWKHKEIRIGGVIDYNNASSNTIKFFTQSMYSHTNFFDPVSGLSIGSEDLQSVMLKDYNNFKDPREFYYVAKKLNLDYLTFIYSFDYSQKVFDKLGKSTKHNTAIKEKFIKYCVFKSYNPKARLEDVLSVHVDYLETDETISAQVEEFLWAKWSIRQGKFPTMNERQYNKFLGFLKEFILLGILKHIILSMTKSYDLTGTLSTSLSPWSKISLDQDNYFCSEFIAESLLFTGIYPFDIQTKDPKSISPGDIMDMSMLFDNTTTRLYYVKHNEELRQIEASSYEDSFIKNYIISKEKQKPEFNKQILMIAGLASLIDARVFQKTTVGAIRKVNKMSQGKLFAGFSLVALVGLTTPFVYTMDINQSHFTALSDNAVVMFLKSSFIWSGEVIINTVFLGLSLYFIFFYVIPYLMTLKAKTGFKK